MQSIYSISNDKVSITVYPFRDLLYISYRRKMIVRKGLAVDDFHQKVFLSKSHLAKIKGYKSPKDVYDYVLKHQIDAPNMIEKYSIWFASQV